MRAARLFGLLILGLVTALALRQLGRAEQHRPGDFDYYVLVLGWSPTYCAAEGKARHDRDCTDGHAHAFTLHGLWPQYAKGWPEDCNVGKRPWVPQSVIDEIHDIMPSRNLVIHEYRAHGTCSGLDPGQYFGLARTLYKRITPPPAFVAPEERLSLSPEEIEAEFLRANPWLDASMIAVTCRRQALLDVRVCFDRDLLPRSCGPNEERRDCRLGKLSVPASGSR
jgi:ribonuclease T2